MKILGRFHINTNKGLERRVTNEVKSRVENEDFLNELLNENRRLANHGLFRGTYVYPDQAMSIPTVAAAVRAISGAIGQMPIKLYKENRDGDVTPFIKPSLKRILNVEPSLKWSASAMWKKVVKEVMLYGNSYVLIERPPGGDVFNLIPLVNEKVRVRDEGSHLEYEYQFDAGRTRTVHQNDVLHFHSGDFDGVTGRSFLENGASSSIVLNQQMRRFATGHFETGTLSDVLISGKFTPEQGIELKKEWIKNNSRGLKSRGTPVVAGGDLKINRHDVNLNEQQLVEARMESRREIAESLGVPGAVLGQDSQLTGTGIQQIGSFFIRYGVQPLASEFEAEMNRKLFLVNNRRRLPQDVCFVKFDTLNIVRGTYQEWLTLLQSLVGHPGAAGILTRNEARQAAGYERLDKPEYDELSRGGPDNIPGTGQNNPQQQSQPLMEGEQDEQREDIV